MRPSTNRHHFPTGLEDAPHLRSIFSKYSRNSSIGLLSLSSSSLVTVSRPIRLSPPTQGRSASYSHHIAAFPHVPCPLSPVGLAVTVLLSFASTFTPSLTLTPPSVFVGLSLRHELSSNQGVYWLLSSANGLGLFFSPASVTYHSLSAPRVC